jgi:phage tail-like protein
MDGDRSVSLLVQPDQWARCAHDGTVLLPGGGIELDWQEDSPTKPSAGCSKPTRTVACAEPAGLAFDRWCAAYVSRPACGAVDVVEPRRNAVATPCPGAFARPRGLAVDRRQRLYIVETAARTVLVVDLPSGRARRRVPICPGRPVDAVADCGRVIVLARAPDALFILDGRSNARPGPVLIPPRCPRGLQPTRLTRGPTILWTGQGPDAPAFVATADGRVLLEVPGATDLELTPNGVLVVARGVGEPFRRFAENQDAWVELEPLGAPSYDGGAVTVTPAGRVAFTTKDGYATTTGSTARHVDEGSVVSYRFDSGQYRTRWGRMFVDACLPPGTSVAAQFLTTDTDDVLDPIPPSAPARGSVDVRHPEQTPPLPSATLLSSLDDPSPLFRRPTGSEQPWSSSSGDVETYESPVAAPPGRYLWVRLVLQGNEQVTPRVAALRIERPGHRLLDSLPLSWSSDDDDADFLQRYLAPLDGFLHDLDWQAAQRAILLDPRSTPGEALSWLASFAGLVLDGRWSDEARRTLVAEAYGLYARRGTKAALLRLLEIYLGRPPTLVEAWQLRGLGGVVLGAGPDGLEAPVVGGSARTTGTLGRFTVGGAQKHPDSYELTAHRFTVLVPGKLTDEQRSIIEKLVIEHRPAHTTCDICELGSGMRVSRMRISLTSFVGPTTGWTSMVVGQTRLTADGVVGTPAFGSRVGTSAAVGEVRVG